MSDAHSESDSLPVLDGGPGYAAYAAYAVKLPLFEGPLDLLLHLIRQNEVEIVDIPIAKVAEQYLAYIEMMKDLNIDVAGEYLLMAATLALIKSRMLLPRESLGEDGEDGDNRIDLVTRLLEYQRYKEAAETLAQRRLLGRDVYRAEGSAPEPVPEAEREIEVGLFDLLEAFRSVLATVPADDRSHAVETEEITVRERMIYVMDLFHTAETVEFSGIFVSPGGRPVSRALIVATFLGVLELARLSALHIFQSLNAIGVPEGEIRLRAVELSEGELQWADRITDSM